MKMEVLNFIHRYTNYPDGHTPEQVEEKFSYGLVGTSGAYNFGRISQDKFYDYSERFFATMKYSNGNREEIIKYIIDKENNFTDSTVELVE